MANSDSENKRLEWLCRYLLDENPRYRQMPVPDTLQERRDLFRALMNVRPPMPAARSSLRRLAQVCASGHSSVSHSTVSRLPAPWSDSSRSRSLKPRSSALCTLSASRMTQSAYAATRPSCSFDSSGSFPGAIHTAIFSLPKRSDTSLSISRLEGFEAFSTAFLQPAYRIFLTSSTRFTLPAPHMGISVILAILRIRVRESSCSSSPSDWSKTSRTSAPRSEYSCASRAASPEAYSLLSVSDETALPLFRKTADTSFFSIINLPVRYFPWWRVHP